MAKQDVPVQSPTPSSDGGIKAVVTIRHKRGEREMALRDWFANNCGPTGITLTIPELGLSRRYSSPESIPAMGDFVQWNPKYAFIIFRSE
jgi:hypothetical protein